MVTPCEGKGAFADVAADGHARTRGPRSFSVNSSPGRGSSSPTQLRAGTILPRTADGDLALAGEGGIVQRRAAVEGKSSPSAVDMPACCHR